MHQSIFTKGKSRHVGNFRVAMPQGAYCFLWAPVANTSQERLLAKQFVLSLPSPWGLWAKSSCQCPLNKDQQHCWSLLPWNIIFQAQQCLVWALHKRNLSRKMLFSRGIRGWTQGPDTSSLNEMSVIFTLYLNCFNWAFLQVWNLFLNKNLNTSAAENIWLPMLTQTIKGIFLK